LEFYDDYYSYPLYRDEDKVFYEALGNRKLKLGTWNPIKLWKGFKEVGSRMKKKNVQGNLKGEGLIQGGFILFGNDGSAKYAYLEETGVDLETDDLLAAVNAMKKES